MVKYNIPLSVPSLKGNELRYVSDCIYTEWVSSVGSYVDDFEKMVADHVNAKCAIACVNGTSALHISLILGGVGHEDEVIVPTLTFIAPINVVKYVGAHPVFMDCDDNLNIDVDKVLEFCERECFFDGKSLINKKSGRRIKAIMPVHVSGNLVDIEPLMELASLYHLWIVEDATESLGSYYVRGKYEGKKSGTIGNVGCYSFNGNKIITTGGGGMIVTDDESLARRARYLTTQAKDDSAKFTHHNVGYNYRLTNVQAAIGCAQMERLHEFIQIKRKNYELYRQKIGDLAGLSMIGEAGFCRSNYWQYTLVVDKNQYGESALEIMEKLRASGIESRPIWELNHRQRPYSDCQAYKIDKATSYHEKCLNLPCSVSLGCSEVEKVCRIIKNRK